MPKPQAVARSIRPARAARGEPIVRAVLDAALVELARVGVGALSIEDVAARAGVNKTTVYRRFPTKWELIGAALEQSRRHLVVPDTGTLRGDLVGILLEAARFLTSPIGRSVFSFLVTDAQQKEIAPIIRRLRRKEEDPALFVLRRALARGELSPEVDLQLVVRQLIGPVIHHVILDGEVLREDDARAMATLVIGGLNGIREAAASSATPRTARKPRRAAP